MLTQTFPKGLLVYFILVISSSLSSHSSSSLVFFLITGVSEVIECVKLVYLILYELLMRFPTT